MLFDPMNVLKAKMYEVVEEKTEGYRGKDAKHLIKPVGTDTETVKIDPVQLVTDFITLIGEYAKCEHLLRMVSFGCISLKSYKGIRDKRGQNQVRYQNQRYLDEKRKMQDALMQFVNKYGLLELLNDEALGFDYNKPINNEDGQGVEYWHMKEPDSVIVYSSEFGPYTRIPYDEYIEKYFPGCKADEAVKLIGPARVLQYSEYMEDILQNRRFMDCVEYIAGIDRGRGASLSIYDLKATLSFKEDAREYDVQSRSLIQYCHTMFFLNELGVGKNIVHICQYRLCHKPFLENKKYCSEKCMRNAHAHKAKKRGVQENGKETR